MRNFRKRKFTTRYTNIDQAGIEKLRATRLANSKTYAEKRFFSSQEFDKQIRRNIKSNRVAKNVKALNRISSRIGDTQDQRTNLESFFGEKTRYTKNGKRTVNSFSSLRQTRRLQKLEKQIKNNNFKLLKRVSNDSQFKENRKYLPTHPSKNDIIQALSNKPFYYENKDDIKTFNAHVQKNGYKSASRTKAGRSLQETYKESLNEEDESLFDAMY